MKYKITWKDIIIENSIRYICIGFPVYIVAVFALLLIMQFFNETLGSYSIGSYVTGMLHSIFILICMFLIIVCVSIVSYFRYWKSSVVGEHELFIDGEFFTWKGNRGEVKTKLSFLKNFTVKRNYLLIKFIGLPTAKIKKKWIIEGYDKFVQDMTKVLSKNT